MTALDISKKYANRLRLLCAIYKASTVNPVNAQEIGATIGLKNGNMQDAYDFLKGDGYIEDSNDYIGATITHSGKKIVEKAIMNENESIEDFPPYSEIK